MAHQHQKRRLTLRGDVDHRAYKSQRISSASYERYTVAWICALPKEMVAAQAVLDALKQSEIYSALEALTHYNDTYKKYLIFVVSLAVLFLISRGIFNNLLSNTKKGQ